MGSFKDFAQRLFPGDRVDQFRNPPDVPPEVQPLLEEVASCTNINVDWLEKTAGLVIDGLAGLQCLWYLHGLTGDIKNKTDSRPTPYLWVELDGLRRQEEKRLLTKMRSRYPRAVLVITIDWANGTATENYTTFKEWEQFTDLEVEEKENRGEWPPSNERVTKLGKWLNKVGASNDLKKAFEERTPQNWHWEISCHPYDILTMSYNRPWTSCMRPGGLFQFGPLTDLAAGSALLLFFRPGAAKPCGRRILRPYVWKRGQGYMMGVLDAGTSYGSFPILNTHQIESMISKAGGGQVPIVKDSLCSPGRLGEALSRHIYSDADGHGCQQTDEEYELAYHTLDEQEWPEINLDFTNIQAVAEEFKSVIEIDWDVFEKKVSEAGASDLVEQAANEVIEDIEDKFDPSYIYRLVIGSQPRDEIPLFVYTQGALSRAFYEEFGEEVEPNRDLENDCERIVRDHFIQKLREQFNLERTLVVSYSSDYTRQDAEELTKEYPIQVWLALDLESSGADNETIDKLGLVNDGESILVWHDPEGCQVQFIVFIPEEFVEEVMQKLEKNSWAICNQFYTDFFDYGEGW